MAISSISSSIGLSQGPQTRPQAILKPSAATNSLTKEDVYLGYVDEVISEGVPASVGRERLQPLQEGEDTELQSGDEVRLNLLSLRRREQL